jgi:hypothetical protein
MTESDFLNAAIDDALESVRHLERAARRIPFRDGAVIGLESCRGQTRDQIRARLADATRARERIPRTEGDPAHLAAYWRARSTEAQIAWILEILIARDDLLGLRTAEVVSARAARAAATILGCPVA